MARLVHDPYSSSGGMISYADLRGVIFSASTGRVSFPAPPTPPALGTGFGAAAAPSAQQQLPGLHPNGGAGVWGIFAPSAGATLPHIPVPEAVPLHKGPVSGGSSSPSRALEPLSCSPLCDHTSAWRRLRGKRGHGYYICSQCGAKWKSRYNFH
eukprot:RCo000971